MEPLSRRTKLRATTWLWALCFAHLLNIEHGTVVLSQSTTEPPSPADSVADAFIVVYNPSIVGLDFYVQDTASEVELQGLIYNQGVAVKDVTNGEVMSLGAKLESMGQYIEFALYVRAPNLQEIARRVFSPYQELSSLDAVSLYPYNNYTLLLRLPFTILTKPNLEPNISASDIGISAYRLGENDPRFLDDFSNVEESFLPGYWNDVDPPSVIASNAIVTSCNCGSEAGLLIPAFQSLRISGLPVTESPASWRGPFYLSPEANLVGYDFTVTGSIPMRCWGLYFNRSIAEWSPMEGDIQTNIQSIRDTLRNTILNVWVYDTGTGQVLAHQVLEAFQERVRFTKPVNLGAGKAYSVVASLPMILLTDRQVVEYGTGSNNLDIIAYRFGLQPSVSNASYGPATGEQWSFWPVYSFPIATTQSYPGETPPWWAYLPDNVDHQYETDSSYTGAGEMASVLNKEAALAEGMTLFHVPNLLMARPRPKVAGTPGLVASLGDDNPTSAVSPPFVNGTWTTGTRVGFSFWTKRGASLTALGVWNQLLSWDQLPPFAPTEGNDTFGPPGVRVELISRESNLILAAADVSFGDDIIDSYYYAAVFPPVELKASTEYGIVLTSAAGMPRFMLNSSTTTSDLLGRQFIMGQCLEGSSLSHNLSALWETEPKVDPNFEGNEVYPAVSFLYTRRPTGGLQGESPLLYTPSFGGNTLSINPEGSSLMGWQITPRIQTMISAVGFLSPWNLWGSELSPPESAIPVGIYDLSAGGILLASAKVFHPSAASFSSGVTSPGVVYDALENGPITLFPGRYYGIVAFISYSIPGTTAIHQKGPIVVFSRLKGSISLPGTQSNGDTLPPFASLYPVGQNFDTTGAGFEYTYSESLPMVDFLYTRPDEANAIFGQPLFGSRNSSAQSCGLAKGTLAAFSFVAQVDMYISAVGFVLPDWMASSHSPAEGNDSSCSLEEDDVESMRFSARWAATVGLYDDLGQLIDWTQVGPASPRGFSSSSAINNQTKQDVVYSAMHNSSGLVLRPGKLYTLVGSLPFFLNNTRNASNSSSDTSPLVHMTRRYITFDSEAEAQTRGYSSLPQSLSALPLGDGCAIGPFSDCEPDFAIEELLDVLYVRISPPISSPLSPALQLLLPPPLPAALPSCSLKAEFGVYSGFWFSPTEDIEVSALGITVPSFKEDICRFNWVYYPNMANTISQVGLYNVTSNATSPARVFTLIATVTVGSWSPLYGGQQLEGLASKVHLRAGGDYAVIGNLPFARVIEGFSEDIWWNGVGYARSFNVYRTMLEALELPMALPLEINSERLASNLQSTESQPIPDNSHQLLSSVAVAFDRLFPSGPGVPGAYFELSQPSLLGYDFYVTSTSDFKVDGLLYNQGALLRDLTTGQTTTLTEKIMTAGQYPYIAVYSRASGYFHPVYYGSVPPYSTRNAVSFTLQGGVLYTILVSLPFTVLTEVDVSVPFKDNIVVTAYRFGANDPRNVLYLDEGDLPAYWNHSEPALNTGTTVLGNSALYGTAYSLIVPLLEGYSTYPPTEAPVPTPPPQNAWTGPYYLTSAPNLVGYDFTVTGTIPLSCWGLHFNRSIMEWDVNSSNSSVGGGGGISSRDVLRNASLNIWLYDTASNQLLAHQILPDHQDGLRFERAVVLAAGKTYTLLASLPMILLTNRKISQYPGGHGVDVSAYRLGLGARSNATFDPLTGGWSNITAEWFPLAEHYGYPNIAPPWWPLLPDAANGSMPTGSDSGASQNGEQLSPAITKSAALEEGFTLFHMPTLQVSALRPSVAGKPGVLAPEEAASTLSWLNGTWTESQQVGFRFITRRRALITALGVWSELLTSQLDCPLCMVGATPAQVQVNLIDYQSQILLTSTSVSLVNEVRDGYHYAALFPALELEPDIEFSIVMKILPGMPRRVADGAFSARLSSHFALRDFIELVDGYGINNTQDTVYKSHIQANELPSPTVSFLFTRPAPGTVEGNSPVRYGVYSGGLSYLDPAGSSLVGLQVLPKVVTKVTALGVLSPYFFEWGLTPLETAVPVGIYDLTAGSVLLGSTTVFHRSTASVRVDHTSPSVLYSPLEQEPILIYPGRRYGIVARVSYRIGGTFSLPQRQTTELLDIYSWLQGPPMVGSSPGDPLPSIAPLFSVADGGSFGTMGQYSYSASLPMVDLLYTEVPYGDGLLVGQPLYGLELTEACAIPQEAVVAFSFVPLSDVYLSAVGFALPKSWNSDLLNNNNGTNCTSDPDTMEELRDRTRWSSVIGVYDWQGELILSTIIGPGSTKRGSTLYGSFHNSSAQLLRADSTYTVVGLLPVHFQAFGNATSLGVGPANFVEVKRRYLPKPVPYSTGNNIPPFRLFNNLAAIGLGEGCDVASSSCVASAEGMDGLLDLALTRVEHPFQPFPVGDTAIFPPHTGAGGICALPVPYGFLSGFTFVPIEDVEISTLGVIMPSHDEPLCRLNGTFHLNMGMGSSQVGVYGLNASSPNSSKLSLLGSLTIGPWSPTIGMQQQLEVLSTKVHLQAGKLYAIAGSLPFVRVVGDYALPWVQSPGKSPWWNGVGYSTSFYNAHGRNEVMASGGLLPTELESQRLWAYSANETLAASYPIESLLPSVFAMFNRRPIPPSGDISVQIHELVVDGCPRTETATDRLLLGYNFKPLTDIVVTSIGIAEPLWNCSSLLNFSSQHIDTQRYGWGHAITVAIYNDHTGVEVLRARVEPSNPFFPALGMRVTVLDYLPVVQLSYDGSLPTQIRGLRLSGQESYTLVVNLPVPPTTTPMRTTYSVQQQDISFGERKQGGPYYASPDSIWLVTGDYYSNSLPPVDSLGLVAFTYQKLQPSGPTPTVPPPLPDGNASTPQYGPFYLPSPPMVAGFDFSIMDDRPWSISGFDFKRQAVDVVVADGPVPTMPQVQALLASAEIPLWIYDTTSGSSVLLTTDTLLPYSDRVLFDTPVVLLPGRTYSVLVAVPALLLTTAKPWDFLEPNIAVSAYRLAPESTIEHLANGSSVVQFQHTHRLPLYGNVADATFVWSEVLGGESLNSSSAGVNSSLNSGNGSIIPQWDGGLGVGSRVLYPHLPAIWTARLRPSVSGHSAVSMDEDLRNQSLAINGTWKGGLITGFSFRPKHATLLTALGVWEDYFKYSLVDEANEIGPFEATVSLYAQQQGGILLANVTVNFANAAIDRFRYAAVLPAIQLMAGAEYAVIMNTSYTNVPKFMSGGWGMESSFDYLGPIASPFPAWDQGYIWATPVEAPTMSVLYTRSAAGTLSGKSPLWYSTYSSGPGGLHPQLQQAACFFTGIEVSPQVMTSVTALGIVSPWTTYGEGSGPLESAVPVAVYDLTAGSLLGSTNVFHRSSGSASPSQSSGAAVYNVLEDGPITLLPGRRYAILALVSYVVEGYVYSNYNERLIVVSRLYGAAPSGFGPGHALPQTAPVLASSSLYNYDDPSMSRTVPLVDFLFSSTSSFEVAVDTLARPYFSPKMANACYVPEETLTGFSFVPTADFALTEMGTHIPTKDEIISNPCIDDKEGLLWNVKWSSIMGLYDDGGTLLASAVVGPTDLAYEHDPSAAQASMSSSVSYFGSITVLRASTSSSIPSSLTLLKGQKYTLVGVLPFRLTRLATTAVELSDDASGGLPVLTIGRAFEQRVSDGSDLIRGEHRLPDRLEYLNINHTTMSCSDSPGNCTTSAARGLLNMMLIRIQPSSRVYSSELLPSLYRSSSDICHIRAQNGSYSAFTFSTSAAVFIKGFGVALPPYNEVCRLGNHTTLNTRNVLTNLGLYNLTDPTSPYLIASMMIGPWSSDINGMQQAGGLETPILLPEGGSYGVAAVLPFARAYSNISRPNSSYQGASYSSWGSWWNSGSLLFSGWSHNDYIAPENFMKWGHSLPPWLWSTPSTTPGPLLPSVSILFSRVYTALPGQLAVLLPDVVLHSCNPDTRNASGRVIIGYEFTLSTSLNVTGLGIAEPLWTCGDNATSEATLNGARGWGEPIRVGLFDKYAGRILDFDIETFSPRLSDVSGARFHPIMPSTLSWPYNVNNTMSGSGVVLQPNRIYSLVANVPATAFYPGSCAYESSNLFVGSNITVGSRLSSGPFSVGYDSFYASRYVWHPQDVNASYSVNDFCLDPARLLSFSYLPPLPSQWQQVDNQSSTNGTTGGIPTPFPDLPRPVIQQPVFYAASVPNVAGYDFTVWGSGPWKLFGLEFNRTISHVISHYGASPDSNTSVDLSLLQSTFQSSPLTLWLYETMTGASLANITLAPYKSHARVEPPIVLTPGKSYSVLVRLPMVLLTAESTSNPNLESVIVSGYRFGVDLGGLATTSPNISGEALPWPLAKSEYYQPLSGEGNLEWWWTRLVAHINMSLTGVCMDMSVNGTCQPPLHDTVNTTIDGSESALYYSHRPRLFVDRLRTAVAGENAVIIAGQEPSNLPLLNTSGITFWPTRSILLTALGASEYFFPPHSLSPQVVVSVWEVQRNIMVHSVSVTAGSHYQDSYLYEAVLPPVQLRPDTEYAIVVEAPYDTFSAAPIRMAPAFLGAGFRLGRLLHGWATRSVNVGNNTEGQGEFLSGNSSEGLGSAGISIPSSFLYTRPATGSVEGESLISYYSGSPVYGTVDPIISSFVGLEVAVRVPTVITAVGVLSPVTVYGSERALPLESAVPVGIYDMTSGLLLGSTKIFHRSASSARPEYMSEGAAYSILDQGPTTLYPGRRYAVTALVSYEIVGSASSNWNERLTVLSKFRTPATGFLPGDDLPWTLPPVPATQIVSGTGTDYWHSEGSWLPIVDILYARGYEYSFAKPFQPLPTFDSCGVAESVETGFSFTVRADIYIAAMGVASPVAWTGVCDEENITNVINGNDRGLYDATESEELVYSARWSSILGIYDARGYLLNSARVGPGSGRRLQELGGTIYSSLRFENSMILRKGERYTIVGRLPYFVNTSRSNGNGQPPSTMSPDDVIQIESSFFSFPSRNSYEDLGSSGPANYGLPYTLYNLNLQPCLASFCRNESIKGLLDFLYYRVPTTKMVSSGSVFPLSNPTGWNPDICHIKVHSGVYSGFTFSTESTVFLKGFGLYRASGDICVGNGTYLANARELYGQIGVYNLTDSGNMTLLASIVVGGWSAIMEMQHVGGLPSGMVLPAGGRYGVLALLPFVRRRQTTFANISNGGVLGPAGEINTSTLASLVGVGNASLFSLPRVNTTSSLDSAEIPSWWPIKGDAELLLARENLSAVSMVIVRPSGEPSGTPAGRMGQLLLDSCPSSSSIGNKPISGAPLEPGRVLLGYEFRPSLNMTLTGLGVVEPQWNNCSSGLTSGWDGPVTIAIYNALYGYEVARAVVEVVDPIVEAAGGRFRRAETNAYNSFNTYPGTSGFSGPAYYPPAPQLLANTSYLLIANLPVFNVSSRQAASFLVNPNITIGHRISHWLYANDPYSSTAMWYTRENSTWTLDPAALMTFTYLPTSEAPSNDTQSKPSPPPSGAPPPTAPPPTAPPPASASLVLLSVDTSKVGYDFVVPKGTIEVQGLYFKREGFINSYTLPTPDTTMKLQQNFISAAIPISIYKSGSPPSLLVNVTLAPYSHYLSLNRSLFLESGYTYTLTAELPMTLAAQNVASGCNNYVKVIDYRLGLSGCYPSVLEGCSGLELGGLPKPLHWELVDAAVRAEGVRGMNISAFRRESRTCSVPSCSVTSSLTWNAQCLLPYVPQLSFGGGSSSDRDEDFDTEAVAMQNTSVIRVDSLAGPLMSTDFYPYEDILITSLGLVDLNQENCLGCTNHTRDTQAVVMVDDQNQVVAEGLFSSRRGKLIRGFRYMSVRPPVRLRRGRRYALRTSLSLTIQMSQTQVWSMFSEESIRFDVVCDMRTSFNCTSAVGKAPWAISGLWNGAGFMYTRSNSFYSGVGTPLFLDQKGFFPVVRKDLQTVHTLALLQVKPEISTSMLAVGLLREALEDAFHQLGSPSVDMGRLELGIYDENLVLRGSTRFRLSVLAAFLHEGDDYAYYHLPGTFTLHAGTTYYLAATVPGKYLRSGPRHVERSPQFRGQTTAFTIAYYQGTSSLPASLDPQLVLQYAGNRTARSGFCPGPGLRDEVEVPVLTIKFRRHAPGPVGEAALKFASVHLCNQRQTSYSFTFTVQQELMVTSFGSVLPSPSGGCWSNLTQSAMTNVALQLSEQGSGKLLTSFSLSIEPPPFMSDSLSFDYEGANSYVAYGALGQSISLKPGLRYTLSGVLPFELTVTHYTHPMVTMLTSSVDNNTTTLGSVLESPKVPLTFLFARKSKAIGPDYQPKGYLAPASIVPFSGPKLHEERSLIVGYQFTPLQDVLLTGAAVALPFTMEAQTPTYHVGIYEAYSVSAPYISGSRLASVYLGDWSDVTRNRLVTSFESPLLLRRGQMYFMAALMHEPVLLSCAGSDRYDPVLGEFHPLAIEPNNEREYGMAVSSMATSLPRDFWTQSWDNALPYQACSPVSAIYTRYPRERPLGNLSVQYLLETTHTQGWGLPMSNASMVFVARAMQFTPTSDITLTGLGVPTYFFNTSGTNLSSIRVELLQGSKLLARSDVSRYSATADSARSVVLEPIERKLLTRGLQYHLRAILPNISLPFGISASPSAPYTMNSYSYVNLPQTPEERAHFNLTAELLDPTKRVNDGGTPSMVFSFVPKSAMQSIIGNIVPPTKVAAARCVRESTEIRMDFVPAANITVTGLGVLDVASPLLCEGLGDASVALRLYETMTGKVLAQSNVSSDSQRVNSYRFSGLSESAQLNGGSHYSLTAVLPMRYLELEENRETATGPTASQMKLRWASFSCQRIFESNQTGDAVNTSTFSNTPGVSGYSATQSCGPITAPLFDIVALEPPQPTPRAFGFLSSWLPSPTNTSTCSAAWTATAFTVKQEALVTGLGIGAPPYRIGEDWTSTNLALLRFFNKTFFPTLGSLTLSNRSQVLEGAAEYFAEPILLQAGPIYIVLSNRCFTASVASVNSTFINAFGTFSGPQSFKDDILGTSLNLESGSPLTPILTRRPEAPMLSEAPRTAYSGLPNPLPAGTSCAVSSNEGYVTLDFNLFVPAKLSGICIQQEYLSPTRLSAIPWVPPYAVEPNVGLFEDGILLTMARVSQLSPSRKVDGRLCGFPGVSRDLVPGRRYSLITATSNVLCATTSLTQGQPEMIISGARFLNVQGRFDSLPANLGPDSGQPVSSYPALSLMIEREHQSVDGLWSAMSLFNHRTPFSLTQSWSYRRVAYSLRAQRDLTLKGVSIPAAWGPEGGACVKATGTIYVEGLARVNFTLSCLLPMRDQELVFQTPEPLNLTRGSSVTLLVHLLHSPLPPAPSKVAEDFVLESLSMDSEDSLSSFLWEPRPSTISSRAPLLGTMNSSSTSSPKPGLSELLPIKWKTSQQPGIDSGQQTSGNQASGSVVSVVRLIYTRSQPMSKLATRCIPGDTIRQKRLMQTRSVPARFIATKFAFAFAHNSDSWWTSRDQLHFLHDAVLLHLTQIFGFNEEHVVVLLNKVEGLCLPNLADNGRSRSVIKVEVRLLRPTPIKAMWISSICRSLVDLNVIEKPDYCQTLQAAGLSYLNGDADISYRDQITRLLSGGDTSARLRQ